MGLNYLRAGFCENIQMNNDDKEKKNKIMHRRWERYMLKAKPKPLSFSLFAEPFWMSQQWSFFKRHQNTVQTVRSLMHEHTTLCSDARVLKPRHLITDSNAKTCTDIFLHDRFSSGCIFSHRLLICSNSRVPESHSSLIAKPNGLSWTLIDFERVQNAMRVDESHVYVLWELYESRRGLHSYLPMIEAARTPISNLAVSPPRGHYTLPAMAKSSLVLGSPQSEQQHSSSARGHMQHCYCIDRCTVASLGMTARKNPSTRQSSHCKARWRASQSNEFTPECARLVYLFRERDNRIRLL